MHYYEVPCECGQAILVTSTQAGSQVRCGCGRAVIVPTLSKLRRDAGQPSIVLDTIQRIELMIDQGELPTGVLCPISGRMADATVYFHVQCESVWVRGDERAQVASSLLAALVGVFVGGLGAWGMSTGARAAEVQECGRDSYVVIPLRIASTEIQSAKGLDQAALRRLLATVPIYAQLLADYPTAKIFYLGEP